MSQTAVFVKVNDILYPCIEFSIPDINDAIHIVEDMIEELECLPESSEYDVEAKWFEIGDGECGMDTFFSEDDLLEWYEKGEFEMNVEAAGQYAEHIQSESLTVSLEQCE